MVASLRLRLPGGVLVGGAASFREVVEPMDGDGEAGAAAAAALDDEVVVFLFESFEAADVSEPLKAAFWLSRNDDMVAAAPAPEFSPAERS